MVIGGVDSREGTEIRLTEVSIDPDSSTDAGVLYAKDVATITELFYEDSAGTVVQVTSNGSINAGVTSPLQLSDGSAGTPTYSFSSDTNTGLYRVGADNLAVTTGGLINTSFAGVVSAVNYVEITNSITAESPSIVATGSDTNIDLTLRGKGATGQVVVDNAAGDAALRISYSGGGGGGTLTLKDSSATAQLITATDALSIDAASGMTLTYNSSSRITIDATGQSFASVSTFAVGSESAPSISFIGDSNTGMYWVSADRIAFTLSGKRNLQLQSVASAVNYLGLTNAATGGEVIIFTNGTDSSIDLNLQVKGDTGQVVFSSSGVNPGGTAAAPLISFQSDKDTGMYRVSADVLGFSVGSALKLRVDSGGVLVDGSASDATDPVYSFTNDGDTGMFWSATDTVALSAGGSEKFQVGTIAARFLNLSRINLEDGTETGPYLTWFGDNDTGIYRPGPDQIGFSVQADNVLLLTSGDPSAVNEVTITNAATASGPQISATGSDIDIDLSLVAKGSGNVVVSGSDLQFDTVNSNIRDSNGNIIIAFTDVASADEYVGISNGTVFPAIEARGASANIDLKLSPKGTGTIRLGISQLSADSNSPTHINTPTGVPATQSGWLRVITDDGDRHIPVWSGAI